MLRTDRVAAGIKLLNEREPDWLKKIDVPNLQVHTLGFCVLGQVYGSFFQGLIALDLTPTIAFNFGFDRRRTEDGDYELLQTEWEQQLKALLA